MSRVISPSTLPIEPSFVYVYVVQKYILKVAGVREAVSGIVFKTSRPRLFTMYKFACLTVSAHFSKFVFSKTISCSDKVYHHAVTGDGLIKMGFMPERQIYNYK